MNGAGVQIGGDVGNFYPGFVTFGCIGTTRRLFVLLKKNTLRVTVVWITTDALR